MSTIASITKKRVGDIGLYNLAVEGDESYIANGIIVHNCKSRLIPNEKGSDKNPEINRGGTSISQKGLNSISLCEHDYHLHIELGEEKAGPMGV